MLTQKEINRFLSEECLIEKAKLFKEIKERTRANYVCLSLKLYDTVRNLKRLYKVNNLIKEYAELYKQGYIKKMVVYELSNLPQQDQIRLYNLFSEKLDRWKSFKSALKDISQYRKEKEEYMKLDIYFASRKLMDSLADDMENTK